MALNDWLVTKVIAPFKSVLTQGITPKKLAFTISLGTSIGIFPVIGSTTLICTIIALSLRLNMVILQAINYLMYPLQLIAIVPFVLIGNRIMGISTEFNIQIIIENFQKDFLKALAVFWNVIFAGVLGWLITMPLLFVVVYLISYFVLKKLLAKRN